MAEQIIFIRAVKKAVLSSSPPCPTPGPETKCESSFPTSVLGQARTPANDFLVLLSIIVPCDELLSSLRTKPESKNIYILPIYACYKRRKYELFKFNFFM